MTKMTIVDSNTLKRKLKLIAYTGLIAVASYTTIRAIGLGFDKLDKGIDNAVAQNRVEELIEEEKYVDAKTVLKLYEIDKTIDPKSLVELKHTLNNSEFVTQKRIFKEKKDNVTRTIDSLLMIGETENAKNVLNKSNKFYSKSEIDSLNKVITENSEGYIYNLTRDSISGNKYKILYLNKFGNGVHRKEIISEVLTESLNGLIKVMNEQTDIKLVDILIKDYKKRLNTFKSEDVNLPDDFSSKLKAGLDNYTPKTQWVTYHHISEVYNGMPVIVNGKNYSNYTNTYLVERSKNISKNSKGKVVHYDDDNTLFVEFDTSCSWSREWEGMSSYWKNNKKNIVAYHLSELLYPSTKYNKETLVQDVLDIAKIIDKNY
ncbi:MAG: hypothetical protein ACP5N1_01520 [Candidatus Woesearchaeota archaeon]